MRMMLIKPNMLGKYTVMVGGTLVGDNFETEVEATEALLKYLKPPVKRKRK